MIFAWNAADPVTGNGDWKYHGGNQRSQRAVMLLNFKGESLNDQNSVPAGIKSVDYRMNNVIFIENLISLFLKCLVFSLKYLL